MSSYDDLNRDEEGSEIEPSPLHQHTRRPGGNQASYSEVKGGVVEEELDEEVEFVDLQRHRKGSETHSHVSEVGRDPLAKDSSMIIFVGYDVLILLFLLGLVTGVINGCIAWVIKLLSQLQAAILTSGTPGPFYFLLTTTFFCAVSASIVKWGNSKATFGTGMPEVKALLVHDYQPSEFENIVSSKISCVRISSLIIAAGSGLSIGTAAPLVHVSLCTSYFVMRLVPIFRDLLKNPAMLKQIFAAAAAVGMSTVFNAPVGGLLFSIEVTSTYYLISNYWRSFMAATTGAMMYNIFMTARGTSDRIFQVDVVVNPYEKWEYMTFALLGLMAGIAGLLFLKVHQAYYLAMRQYFMAHPIVTAAMSGAVTAVLIYAIGAYSDTGVSEQTIVKNLFTGGSISEMHDRTDVSRIGGLFASLLVRIILTIIATSLRVAAGVFMPMFTIGALAGRIFGQIVANASSSSSIYVDGYAMVGAAAFLSATTHTISAAVIVVEMTGEIDILLPCLIASVIACGVTKSRTLSLYDQGMVNKGLESFELLLQATGGFNFAADVMDAQVISVTRNCVISDLFMLMNNEEQSTFPVIDNPESCKLVGSIERKDIFAFLKAHFAKHNEERYVLTTLPHDVLAAQRHFARHLKVSEFEMWKKTDQAKAVMGGSFMSRLFPSIYSKPGGMDVSTSSVDSGWGGHGLGEAPPKVTKPAEVPNPLLEGKTFGEEPSLVDPAPAPGADLDGEHSGVLMVPPPPPPSAAPPLPPVPPPSVPPPPVPVHSPVTSTDTDESLVETLLAEAVDITSTPLLPLNGFPFTAQKTFTMDQLYILFEMVKAKVVFVVAEDKRLQGMISKDLLLLSLKKKVN